ncbi:MAG TPA: DNA recombination protein RmuC [Solirubrobacteraceae bacterium]|jgi:DNA recombination protein RmuC|nr:DNA recombination protein RmuC [Solirubrobacteraceae bacterium]
MEAIWLLIGLAAGAILALLALRPRLRAVTAEVEYERRLGAERLASQAQMSDAFKALSTDALQASVGQLAELAKSQLQTAQAQAKGDLDARRRAVEQLVAPLADQLGRVDTQLQALQRERSASQGQLSAQLRQLTETNERLRNETGALVTALRKPNTRGQWGQMQLRKVVELAGMVRHCDFTEQVSIAGEESMLRPDLIVNLPGGKHVVVDAKAPLQGVLDAYEARDEAEREAHLVAHARLLRKHCKALADKAYWTGLPTAPDFVVMFLPGEHLYGAALEVDPTLIEDAMARRVLIATPTTLVAMLQAVAYGWQQERVAESAQAVAETGRELHARLVKLSTLLAKLGRRLTGAVETYNETIGSYESRVLPGARRFAEHGAVSEGRELPPLTQVSISPRSVAAVGEDGDQGDAGEPVEEITARRLRAAE